ncbi:MAG: hypothetical protein ABR511_03400 [Acidimicrobiales bacterium]
MRAVFRAYGGLVFAVASRVLGDRSLAEGATQQPAGGRLAGGRPPGLRDGLYQSDVKANSSVSLKTIVVDQIFGFDPDAALAPTTRSPWASGSSTPWARR